MNGLIPIADVFAQGLCQCGCRQPTGIAAQTKHARGYVKGQPIKYQQGHGLRPPTPEVLFDDKTGCWVWQHGRDAHGYGSTRTGGVRHSVKAHRVYYERARGPVPEGLQLDHLCRNRACVNPAHLEPVTSVENSRRGLKTKLSLSQVQEIRSARDGVTAIARRFGLSRTHVYAIRSGKAWR